MLKNKNFILYMIGGSISSAGTLMSDIGLLFFVYDMTQSSAITSLIGAFETAPFIVFGLIGGVIADWFYRKKLLITIQWLRIPLLLIVILLSAAHQLTVPYLFIFVIFMSLTSCFFNPAHRALLPAITTENTRVQANSFYDIAQRITTIVATITAGLLYHTVVIEIFFFIDLCTYIISVCCIQMMNVEEQVSKQKKSLIRVKDDLLIFFNYIYAKTEIKQLFLITLTMVFLNTWIFDTGLLMLLEQNSRYVQQDYSFYKSYYSFICIFINLFIPLFFMKQSITTYIIGSFIWGAGFLIIAVNQTRLGILAGLLVIGCGLVLSSMTRSYLIQTFVRKEMHARAFSFNAVLLYTANTLSYLSYGMLSEIIEIRYLYMASALMMMTIALICFKFFRRHHQKFTEPRI